MKKIIIGAAVAATILAGCTKNEVRVDVPDSAISFQTIVGKNSTKALVEDATYPTEETFGSVAFLLGEGETWETAHASAEVYIGVSDGLAAGALGVEVSYDEGNKYWTTATPYYWPKTGSLTFFSFSPYEKDFKIDPTNTDGLVIEGWDVHDQATQPTDTDWNQEKDLMVATIQMEQTQNGTNGGYNGVPTIFHHILSYIGGFTIKTDIDYTNGHSDGTWTPGDMTFELKNIKINNIYEKGDYKSGLMPYAAGNTGEGWTIAGGADLAEYTWIGTDAGATGKTFNQTKQEIKPYSSFNKGRDYLLVMPQTFTNNTQNDASITVEYVVKYYNGDTANGNGGWIDYPVTTTTKLYDIHKDNGNKWDLNKKIVYNLVISFKGSTDPDDPSQQILWAPSVVEWTDDPINSEDIVM